MKSLINWIKRMIELIQGTTSAPVDDVRRQEIPSRLAIEKGIYPDEAVVVGQLAGGDGIYVEQINGLDENNVLDKKARGNIVINRNLLSIDLSVNLLHLPYITIGYSKGTMETQYGELIQKSVLTINGVEYQYGTWFVIGMYNIGGYDRYAIEWLGNDMFELETTDSITLRI